MAMVKAKVDCFIDNGFRKAGDEFRYAGPALEGVLEFIDGGPTIEVDEEPAAEPKLRRGRKPKAEITPN
jgi:hypothetical protein